MEQMRVVRQMIDLQRVTFGGMVNNMILFWDQTSNMMNTFLDQAGWLPQEGKKALREWVESNKKGCETFKSAMDNGYSSLEKYFTGNQTQQEQQAV